MKKKILIIDDDLPILEVMKIILEDSNYQIETISNPVSIHKTIEKYMPDLVLVDIWISGVHGREVVKIIRENKKTAHIPVIMVSANNETKKIAEQIQANDFLAKPFDIEDLIAIVRRHIEK